LNFRGLSWEERSLNLAIYIKEVTQQVRRIKVALIRSKLMERFNI